MRTDTTVDSTEVALDEGRVVDIEAGQADDVG